MKTVCIVIPAHNEAGRIGRTLDQYGPFFAVAIVGEGQPRHLALYQNENRLILASLSQSVIYSSKVYITRRKRMKIRFLLMFCIILSTCNLYTAPIAYVANNGSSTVTPIDLATNTPGAPIPVGNGPEGIAITSDNITAYVANFLSDTVTPIDVATNTPGTPIPVGNGPIGIAITPDNKTAYVANNLDGTVTPIDIATNTAGTPIAVGGEPFDIAVAPDGVKAYVTLQPDGEVRVIDVATNTPTAIIVVGFFLSRVTGIAVTPDGKFAYVAVRNNFNVRPITLATNAVGTPIPVGTIPLDVAITPDSKFAYVTNSGSGTVSVIEIATNTVVTSIPVSVPFGIAITSDGKTALVGNNLTATVTPIDIATNTAGTPIPVGANPRGIAITIIPPVPPPPPVFLPPTNFIGTIQKNIFWNKTECVLIAKWFASDSPNIVAYRIYDNDTVIATIDAKSPLQFIMCVQTNFNPAAFSITAVNQTNEESAHVTLRIQ